jgi:hypothetical protein
MMALSAQESRIMQPPIDPRETASDEPFLDAALPSIDPTMMQRRIAEMARINWEDNTSAGETTVFDGTNQTPRVREIKIIGRPTEHSHREPVQLSPGLRRIATIPAPKLITT